MAQVIANRYRITEQIGKGGMGTVYRGVDTRTNQTVAIKQLKPEVSTPELIERFVREGQALRDLNHPNIVKMLDEVSEDGQHYLIMEYLAGGDLHDLLKKEQVSIERCIKLAIEIADALTRTHHLNIIHRDLKPANVLIADDGTPRLTDFGIAHIGKQERVTDTDAIVGTVDYLAPELLDGEDIDTRADIWSFGVMLFEMLAGKRPFSGDSVTLTLMAIMTHPVPDLEALRPDAPVALVDLVYRMLEKSRSARIRSVRQVGLELEDILHGRTTNTPPETRFSPDTPDTLSRPKHNLPAQTTHFVGREAELREVAKLLDDPKLRLITIVASGGMGKTRLALESAEHCVMAWRAMPLPDTFSDGVYFVELAPLSDPTNIVSAIAEATGYQFQSDGRDQKQQILDFLANKNMLLILDNFEHLLEGAPLVTEILKACPTVQILATSRQRLNQSGETIFNLAGMDFPDWETPEDALEYAAVKLFMQSAKRVQPNFEITTDNMNFIARICRLVQGMPLGILLAASWLEMLSVEEISDEIAKGIDFLESDMSDLPKRHRSIRAVFDYSWNLMTEAERAVFMKLSVFRGGFTREAAQEVAEASLRILMSLINKSLIRRDADSGRYEIHELMRQYADAMLSTSDMTEKVQEAHSTYYTELILQVHEKGDASAQWVVIDIENGNIAVAWRYQADVADTQSINKLQPIMRIYWDYHVKLQDAISLTEYAIDRLQTHEQTHIIISTVGRLFGQLAWFYNSLVQPEIGLGYAHKALSLTLEIEDLDGVRSAYQGICICLIFLGEVQQMWDYAQESLEYFRAKNHKPSYAAMLYWAGNAAIYSGRYDEAKKIGQEHAQYHKETNTEIGMGTGYILVLGLAHEMSGEYSEAHRYYEKGLALVKQVEYSWGMGIGYQFLGNNALAQNQLAVAQSHYRNALETMYPRKNVADLIGVLLSIPGLLAAQSKGQRAVSLASLLLNYPKNRKFHTGQSSTLATINRILPQLKSELGEEVYNRAWEQGKSLDLETVVQELLDEFGD